MNPEPVTRLQDLAASDELRTMLLDHAHRGVRVQTILRLCLAALIAGTVLLEPPVSYRLACQIIAAGYVLWAVAAAGIAARGGEGPVRYMWLALFGDLVVVTSLTIVAALSPTNWTADILVFAFFLIPVLAATQLRPWLCAAVCLPTVLLYFVVGVIGRVPNGNEPWSSITLRTLVLAAVSVGAAYLSRVQRSRVLTVGSLALQRSNLVNELVELEQRERRELSEALHDGALQYVLAARMDLEDLDPSATVDRLDEALGAAVKLLRSTVYELHPAVLERNGVRPALGELVTSSAGRGGFSVRIEADGWPAGLRTDADALLFATARELLTNVVKHAHAHQVVLILRHAEGRAYLAVSDDGVGVSDEQLHRQLAAGHIGLTSRRARIEAAGGRFVVSAGAPTGTTVEVDVPAHALPAA